MSESEWGRAWLRSMDVLEMRGSPVAGGLSPVPPWGTFIQQHKIS